MEIRPVLGYESLYEVSESGDVFSLKSERKQLKPILHHTGYFTCRLYKNKDWREFKIHRLIAIAFVPNSDNLPQTNHIDGNRKNNHYSNLEWCTNRENCSHRSSAKTKTSKYPGVHKCKTTGRWRTGVYHNGAGVRLGRFDTEEEAYAAYVDYCEKNKIINKYALCKPQ